MGNILIAFLGLRKTLEKCIYPEGKFVSMLILLICFIFLSLAQTSVTTQSLIIGLDINYQFQIIIIIIQRPILPMRYSQILEKPITINYGQIPSAAQQHL